MVSIKKTTKEGDFFHVRFRQPGRFDRIRTPDWAARVARSESKGAEVRMGRTDAANWFVQSVLVKTGAGKTHADARRLARRIQKEIDE